MSKVNNSTKQNYDIMFKVYNSQQDVTPGLIKWLKLNFSSCVIHSTRSLGALVLYPICSSVCEFNVRYYCRYSVPQVYGRSFARFVYRLK